MLTVYTIDQHEQWDNVVRSFAAYDTYYLSGYVKAFQLHGDGEPLLFYIQNGETRGINVVMKRDIAVNAQFAGKIEEGSLFDFITPYGYGGWLIEGEQPRNLLEEYDRWCKKHGIVSEFVRFHPVLKNHIPTQQDYEVIELGETVTMDLSSPEVIWSNLTSKNRNMVRKAEKNGIRIYSGRCPELYETFRGIYNSTMDKDQATQYYYFAPAFYDSILNDLPRNAQVFYAVMGEQVIAASIMLGSNGMMNYHLSGSVQEYANLAPTNLLLYEAAMWGYENGYKTLYLGGGVGSREDGLLKFKKSFYRGEDLNRFYIGKKIFNEEAYEMLVALREDLPEGGFFPRYRA